MAAPAISASPTSLYNDLWSEFTLALLNFADQHPDKEERESNTEQEETGEEDDDEDHEDDDDGAYARVYSLPDLNLPDKKESTFLLFVTDPTNFRVFQSLEYSHQALDIHPQFTSRSDIKPYDGSNFEDIYLPVRLRIPTRIPLDEGFSIEVLAEARSRHKKNKSKGLDRIVIDIPHDFSDQDILQEWAEILERLLPAMGRKDVSCVINVDSTTNGCISESGDAAFNVMQWDRVWNASASADYNFYINRIHPLIRSAIKELTPSPHKGGRWNVLELCGGDGVLANTLLSGSYDIASYTLVEAMPALVARISNPRIHVKHCDAFALDKYFTSTIAPNLVISSGSILTMGVGELYDNVYALFEKLSQRMHVGTYFIATGYAASWLSAAQFAACGWKVLRTSVPFVEIKHGMLSGGQGSTFLAEQCLHFYVLEKVQPAH